VMNDFRYGRSEIEADVKASDPSVTEKVEFYVDDKLIFIDTEPPYRCVFDFGTEPRSWVIKATAFHREGITVTDQIILRKVIINYAVQVNRVILYSTAISQKDNRKYVLDLKKSDMVLEEDGVRQEIIDFYREERPVTLAVVSDSSGSMQAAMPIVHTAASRFIDTLGAEDKALVIDFDDKVYLLQDVTAQKSDLRSLWPLDWEAIAESVKKTGRLLVAHEDTLSFGYGAEVAALAADRLFHWLDAPIRRVAATDTFVAYEPGLEDAILPQVEGIRAAIAALAAD
jgi:hypothetical protein